MSTISAKLVNEPRNRGAVAPLPTKGEGCTRRFDLDFVTDEQGADFSAAAELWRTLQSQADTQDPLGVVSPEPAASPAKP